MTINEHVSDERLAHIRASYEASRKGYAFIGHPSYDESIAIIDELQQYRAAEPVLYCMEGDRLDDEAVSACKEVVDAWVDEWNGEGRCPGELQYRTVPLYRHAAPQVTSVPEIGEIRVGRLPTMNQDEYPGLGDWWVQLRIGEDYDEVLARVYGATPQEANNRAEALACRAAMLAAPVVQEEQEVKK